MKIVCTWHATEDEVNSIKKAMPAGTEVVTPKGEMFSRLECEYRDIERHIADADVFMGWLIPENALENAKKLKLFCCLNTGINDIDRSLLKEKRVKVTNSRWSAPIAEEAMMYVLALAKKTALRRQQLLEGHLAFPAFQDRNRAAMLEGRTMGIIGVGHLGGLVAKYAKGFDMNVLGVRRNRQQSVPHVDSMHGMDELHSVLAKCDFVVLTAPLTAETKGFFGKAELAAMKPSAFLINVARGPLIQEQHLHAALTSGRLAGFAADVWWSYNPAPVRRHFTGGGVTGRLDIHKLPNVLGSLGQAWIADDVLERTIQSGIQSLVEFASGRPITNEVNLDLGY